MDKLKLANLRNLLTTNSPSCGGWAQYWVRINMYKMHTSGWKYPHKKLDTDVHKYGRNMV